MKKVYFRLTYVAQKRRCLKLPYSEQNEHFIQNNKATDIFIHCYFCQNNLIPVLKFCVVHVLIMKVC